MTNPAEIRQGEALVDLSTGEVLLQWPGGIPPRVEFSIDGKVLLRVDGATIGKYVGSNGKDYEIVPRFLREDDPQQLSRKIEAAARVENESAVIDVSHEVMSSEEVQGLLKDRARRLISAILVESDDAEAVAAVRKRMAELLEAHERGDLIAIREGTIAGIGEWPSNV